LVGFALPLVGFALPLVGFALPLVGFALPLVAEGNVTEGNARPTLQPSGRIGNGLCSQKKSGGKAIAQKKPARHSHCGQVAVYNRSHREMTPIKY
jgi:hypothetical protein